MRQDVLLRVGHTVGHALEELKLDEVAFVLGHMALQALGQCHDQEMRFAFLRDLREHAGLD